MRGRRLGARYLAKVWLRQASDARLRAELNGLNDAERPDSAARMIQDELDRRAVEEPGVGEHLNEELLRAHLVGLEVDGIKSRGDGSYAIVLDGGDLIANVWFDSVSAAEQSKEEF